MIASRSQNQLQSSLAPLGDLLKALMFLSNLNGFNSSPSPPIQGFNQRKGSSRVWKKNGSKWFYHFPLYLLAFVCISCVFCFTFWVSLVLCIALFNMFLFGCFSILFIFFFIKKIKNQNWKIKKIQKQCDTCVPWMAIETKSSKLCISCSVDEHLYAQLNKWDLWLLFVMSKIKLSLVLNISLFLMGMTKKS